MPTLLLLLPLSRLLVASTPLRLPLLPPLPPPVLLLPYPTPPMQASRPSTASQSTANVAAMALLCLV